VSVEQPMLYVKSALFGIAGAIAAAALWVLAAFVLPIVVPMLMARFTRWNVGAGAGIGAASIGSGSILLAALIGFAAAFYWKVRG
jgi:hypothetical protein